MYGVYVQFWPTLRIWCVRPVVCSNQPGCSGLLELQLRILESARVDATMHTSRVGQNHTYLRIHGKYTVFLAGRTPFVRSYTEHMYASGQPYTPVFAYKRALPLPYLYPTETQNCAHAYTYTCAHALTLTHMLTHKHTHTHRRPGCLLLFGSSRDEKQ
jgi:hypothetical protein